MRRTIDELVDAKRHFGSLGALDYLIDCERGVRAVPPNSSSEQSSDELINQLTHQVHQAQEELKWYKERIVDRGYND